MDIQHEKPAGNVSDYSPGQFTKMRASELSIIYFPDEGGEYRRTGCAKIRQNDKGAKEYLGRN
jgi:hypothetical protein